MAYLLLVIANNQVFLGRQMLIVPVDNLSRQSHIPAPKSSGNSTGAEFGETLRQAGSVDNTHTVPRGDTLSEIVATTLRSEGQAVSRWGIYEGVSRVATANGIEDPDRNLVGQRIDLSALTVQRHAGTVTPDAHAVSAHSSGRAAGATRLQSAEGLERVA